MMKKMWLFALVLIFATPSAWATLKEPSSQNYSTFETVEQCVAAFASGEALTPYQPKFRARYEQNPVDGVSRIKAPLPAPACIKGYTLAGTKAVLLPSGMELRWHATNGVSTGTPYAMDWCGNPIYEFRLLKGPDPLTPVTETKVEIVEGPPGPMGPPGPKGGDCSVKTVDGRKAVVCEDGSYAMLPQPMSRGKKVAIGAAASGWVIWATGRLLCLW